MAANQTIDEMEADLGEKLKRLRLNKNLDQKTLAARAGVSVRALRNLESGAGSTVKTLMSVVRALGRESWLQTVAPVPTINPLTLTSRAAQRLRATSKNAHLASVRKDGVRIPAQKRGAVQRLLATQYEAAHEERNDSSEGTEPPTPATKPEER
ncbi:helix-turn-helix transcriptional regulator [Burkholderia ubonensis]|uniref:helix-turn-helix transcriptional regulator n=1 Tax=Burkholderia ubonensis TaxID=101571 RepID=UPI0007C72A26|nr:helix-turn-helix transcriptional regulator [Burkholderia ubonensis]